MAHCPGDDEGTWLVLAILQGNTGDFKGVKTPYMELIARRSWNEQQQQGLGAKGAGGSNGAAAAAAAAAGDDRWMFYKQTNQLPSNGGAEALVALLQLHVPELLADAEGAAAAGQQQGVIGRQVLFNWVNPCFDSSSSGSGSSGCSSRSWYVDLLTPAVEQLGASSSSISISSDAGAGKGAPRLLQQQLSQLPPGVFRMDDYIEQQRILREEEEQRKQQQQQQQQPHQQRRHLPL
jgi:hypothetical protein